MQIQNAPPTHTPKKNNTKRKSHQPHAEIIKNDHVTAAFSKIIIQARNKCALHILYVPTVSMGIYYTDPPWPFISALEEIPKSRLFLE